MKYKEEEEKKNNNLIVQLYAKKLGHLVIPVFPYIYVILKLFHILVDSL
jgi:hypothetical protein